MRFTRQRFQQGSLSKEPRRAGSVWIFRYRDGQNINRKVIVGTVKQYPTKTEARKASEHLRLNINSETFTPRTVSELVTHYNKTEMSETGSKAFSTRQVHGSFIRTHILPKWETYPLSEVKPVAVEAWLAGLPLAEASKAKVRNIMSAVFTHACRYEWAEKNPISLVRQSAKREKIPEVLTVDEIRALLSELESLPLVHTAVFMAVVTGLRVSELMALKWGDINWDAMEITLTRGIFHQHIGEMKTEASRKPIALSSSLAEVLFDWRARTPHKKDGDWIFASASMDGAQPHWPDALLRKTIQPAAVRAGIQKKIGWHTFRRTCATLMQGNGESVKTLQESLRHASSKVSLDLYAQGDMSVKRQAQTKLADAVVPRCSQIGG